MVLHCIVLYTTKLLGGGGSFVKYVLPLSHNYSGALCLYEPLPVSDALGDDFFEIFDVFLVETFFFSFSKLVTLHGPTAAKKTVAPKKAIFCSLSGENNSTKK